MDTERDPEAGTPQEPVAAGEELANADGAPADGSPNEGGGTVKKVTVPFDEYIALKVAAEQRNKAEAEKGARSTTTDTSHSEAAAQRAQADELRAQLAEDERYLARIEEAAKSGNEEARAAVAVHRSAVRSAKASLEAQEKTAHMLEMFEIPEAERAEVKQFMATEGIKSPAVARQYMRGGTKYETQAQEIARLTAALAEAQKPKPVIEPTTVRGAAKASMEKKADGVQVISLTNYQRDMADPVKARSLIALRKAGKLDIQT